jgi:hypothetical protein
MMPVSQSLAKVVFINPAMVIDFNRQVTNHSIENDTNATRARLSERSELLLAAVRDEGCITHGLLAKPDLWGQVDDDAAKSLKLDHFIEQNIYHWVRVIHAHEPGSEGFLHWDQSRPHWTQERHC